MKSVVAILVGVALLVGGGYVLLEGGYFTSRRQVLDVAGLQITTEQRSPIEPWVAGLALVAGTALVVAGFTKKI